MHGTVFGEQRVPLDQRKRVSRLRIKALTVRELSVLHCMVDGLQNKEIARHLGISPRTVEIHRSSIIEKLEAPNGLAAACIGAYAGLGGAGYLKAD